MKYYDIEEVQKELPKLLDEIAVSHEKLIITHNGEAVAVILPCELPKLEATKRHPLHGKEFWMAEDFDEPMEIIWGAKTE